LEQVGLCAGYSNEVHRAESWDILAKLKYWIGNLFDPSNPFLPHVLLLTLVVLALHVYTILWVYRDALRRYNRGAPWALLAAVLPFAGWMFYLLYRKSPLVEFDRIDAELFDENFEWTDYDDYKANQSRLAFAELTSFWHRKDEGSGYSPWVRLSRQREMSRQLTPAEREARKADLAERRAKAVASRKQKLEQRRQNKLERKQEARERQTMTGSHGFKFKLSDRKQRQIKSKLALIEKLKQLPREDHNLEDMIYNMDYDGALAAAREGLELSREMGDQKGIATYEHYIERVERIISESRAE